MSDDAKPVSAERADELDAAMGLKMISIRLPAGVIDDYKLVAEIRGMLYQPLMREALALWVEQAKTNILKGVAFDQREAKRIEPSGVLMQGEKT